MDLYLKHFFMCFMCFLVGSAFLGLAIAGLFGGLHIGVAPWQQFVQAGVLALLISTVSYL
jgi:hypothetical protein